MLNYDIDQDLLEQQKKYLQYLLAVITLGCVAVFSIKMGTNEFFNAPFWLTVTVGIVLTFMLIRKNQIILGKWVFVVGFELACSLLLLEGGPGINTYLLMFVPIFLTVLLAKREGIVTVTVLTVALMSLCSTFRLGILPAISIMLFPTFIAVLLSVVLIVNQSTVLEMVLWAMDIQKKDANRAETFYQQKEQLSETLLQLTHAHSRLELLNLQLAELHKRAERASHAKSVFLSNMSHELRTPLNVIIGYTSSMLDMPEIYDNLSLAPVHQRDIQIVKSSGYYLLGLINDILDLSKIEAGKLELHYNVVNLPGEFKGILATTIGLVKDKPVQIRPDFADDLPYAWADPIRMRQIILNLMSNAVKFTETGSVTLHAHVEGELIHISVIDTGIGIHENALGHIFDRFEQAEDDTDKQYGGTGLGLDISKQLAQMHGGDLTVQSVFGKGSTFSFTLAVATEAQMQEPMVVDTIGASVKTFMPLDTSMIYTVLLVEDEASMRDMLRRTLESDGYNVVDVQDGAHVLEMATGLLPDLIVLDIRLPNVDGWELLASLKKSTDTASIPVIVCTVSEDGERAKELGAALYIRKPFSADEFLSCTQEILSNSLQTNKGSIA